MKTDLVTTWTPILKALPEGQRERARELIEKYGETYPTGFIVELLELFGIHAAYLQTLPNQVIEAGEKAKAEVRTTMDATTALQERTRLELQEIVGAITRSGAGFKKALETSTSVQINAIKNGTDNLAGVIEKEFEQLNLPTLTAYLEEIREQSTETLNEAELIHRNTKRLEQQAQERLEAITERHRETLDKLEQFNWGQAWVTCATVCLALLVVFGVALGKYLRHRADAMLAQQIATATATIEINKHAFKELAIADVRLKVNRSFDASTNLPIASGFAIIVENAQAAELRAGRIGKDGFVFVKSPSPEQEIKQLQIQLEKLSQMKNAGK